MMTVIIALLTLIGPVPPLFSALSNIKKYISVIDSNFVSRASGKRKLYESILKAQRIVDPKCVQMHANRKDEGLMGQCPLLFSKQVDAWHINYFWFLRLFIERQLDKFDSQVKTVANKMQEEAKSHSGHISIIA